MSRPVEIKNVSWQAWRDEWEDGRAPVKYLLQGQIQAGIAREAGLDWGGPIIVALLAGNELKILPHEFDAEAFAMCQERMRVVWADVAAARIVMGGVDLYTLMRIGGWPSLKMVERYAAMSAEHLHAAKRKIA